MVVLGPRYNLKYKFMHALPNKTALFSFFISCLFLVFCGNTQNVKNVSVQEFKALIASGKGIVLDVRSPQEVAQGHIENASVLNFYDDNFESKLAFIQKDKPVYVYCKSGGRSGKAAKLLSKLGQYEVYNLSDGLMAWEKANLPLVAKADIVDEHIKSFSISDFDSLLQVHQKVLVDFHTQWCVPCRKMVPIVAALEVELKEQVFVLRIDLDQSKDLADKYNITSVPTFLLFNNAAEVWRQAGLMTKEALVEQIH